MSGAEDFSELLVDQQLCLALQTTSSLVTRLYRRVLEPLGLTHPQYLVLIALWERGGPRAMGDLGRAVGMETGTLTPLIKRMEASGLVTRTRDTADERRVWVALTPRADSLREPVRIARREVVDRLPITDLQIAQLRATLQEMSRAMERDA